MSKSVGELRAELKALRKEHPEHMPVSKMKKNDITDIIEKMKRSTEITPSVVMDKETRMEATRKSVEKKQPKEQNENKPMKEKKESRMYKVIKEVASESEDEKPKKVSKPKKVDEKPSAKESVAERMARVRAGKGKK
jgi:hypothetical protein